MPDRERKRVPNHRPSLLQHHPLLKTSKTGLRPSSTKGRICIQLYKDGSLTDLQREGLRQIYRGKGSDRSTKGRAQTDLQREGLRQIYTGEDLVGGPRQIHKGKDSEIYKGEDLDKSAKHRTQTNLQRIELRQIYKG